MVLGHYLPYLSGLTYYSPEFPRGGLNATFNAFITDFVLTGGATFLITIETRDNDESTFTSLASFTAISTSGVHTKDVSGLSEMVRFAYTFTNSPAAGDGVHFYMPAPAWRQT